MRSMIPQIQAEMGTIREARVLPPPGQGGLGNGGGGGGGGGNFSDGRQPTSESGSSPPSPRQDGRRGANIGTPMDLSSFRDDIPELSLPHVSPRDRGVLNLNRVEIPVSPMVVTSGIFLYFK